MSRRKSGSSHGQQKGPGTKPENKPSAPPAQAPNVASTAAAEPATTFGIRPPVPDDMTGQPAGKLEQAEFRQMRPIVQEAASSTIIRERVPTRDGTPTKAAALAKETPIARTAPAEKEEIDREEENDDPIPATTVSPRRPPRPQPRPQTKPAAKPKAPAGANPAPTLPERPAGVWIAAWPVMIPLIGLAVLFWVNLIAHLGHAAPFADQRAASIWFMIVGFGIMGLELGRRFGVFAPIAALGMILGLEFVGWLIPPIVRPLSWTVLSGPWGMGSGAAMSDAPTTGVGLGLVVWLMVLAPITRFWLPDDRPQLAGVLRGVLAAALTMLLMMSGCPEGAMAPGMLAKFYTLLVVVAVAILWEESLRGDPMDMPVSIAQLALPGCWMIAQAVVALSTTSGVTWRFAPAVLLIAFAQVTVARLVQLVRYQPAQAAA